MIVNALAHFCDENRTPNAKSLFCAVQTFSTKKNTQEGGEYSCKSFIRPGTLMQVMVRGEEIS